jgi:hypothetical protein
MVWKARFFHQTIYIIAEAKAILPSLISGKFFLLPK